MLFTKKSDQETLKIPFVAISFKSNLRMTGLLAGPRNVGVDLKLENLKLVAEPHIATLHREC